MRPLIFPSIRLDADRRASLTAASTMSSSTSGSSGSIASGLIFTSVSSPEPVAFTVTIPPPAEASTTSVFASSCACASCSCIWAACFISLLKSIPISGSLTVEFVGVECVLEQRDELLLALELRLVRGARLLGRGRAEDELEREPPPGHLEQRIAQLGQVLLVLGELAVEVGAGGELDDEALLLEDDRPRLHEERLRRRRGDRGEDGALPRLLQLLERQRARGQRRRRGRRPGGGGRRDRGGVLGRGRRGDRRRVGRRGGGGRRRRRRARLARRRRRRGSGGAVEALLQLLEAERDRLALEIGGRPRHLHERKLEREPRVAALA